MEKLKQLREALKAKNEEIKAKRAEGEGNTNIESLSKVKEDLRKLCEERDALQEQIDMILDTIEDITKPKPEEVPPVEEGASRSIKARTNINEHPIERTEPIKKVAEGERAERMAKLGEDLKAKRAVKVSSATLLVPTHDKNTIEPTFIQYSSIVDRVNQVNLNGGESYRAPFEKGVIDAEAGTEGVAPTGGQETAFDYAEINKMKIVAYAELSEEVKKLPTANYAERVLEGVKTSIKKKIAEQIMQGAGTANSFTGIFSKAESNKCVLEADDISITAIDENTLTSLVGAVGGDEAIEGAITIILSKVDLLNFAKLRDPATGAKLHNVDFVAQTIDGIPYIISSKCKPVATATAGDYCMVAGILSSYEEAIFSDIEILESNDYKFKEGMICYRGTVFAGGNTTKYRGFVRAKKGAGASGNSETVEFTATEEVEVREISGVVTTNSTVHMTVTNASSATVYDQDVTLQANPSNPKIIVTQYQESEEKVINVMFNTNAEGREYIDKSMLLYPMGVAGYKVKFTITY